MKVLVSDSLDPARNLALEDVLLDEVGRLGTVLMFWRSAGAVVVGRHQNPWRECRLSDVQREGGTLGRRISGGGAVYQDEGNLNFSLMVRRERYERDAPYAVVLRALSGLGVQASRLGKTSLGVEGRKVSGHAFCYRRGAVLHHGTLLLNADLARMQRWLTPARVGFQTHATRSEPSPVMNLAELGGGLTEDRARAALQGECEASFGEASSPLDPREMPREALVRAEARHGGWDWLFGQTPVFSFRSASGLQVKVSKGLILEASGASGKTVRPGQRFGVELADTLSA